MCLPRFSSRILQHARCCVCRAMVRTQRQLYLSRATSVVSAESGFADMSLLRQQDPTVVAQDWMTNCIWSCYYMNRAGVVQAPVLQPDYVPEPEPDTPAERETSTHDDTTMSFGTLGGVHLATAGHISPHDQSICWCAHPHRRSDGTVHAWPAVAAGHDNRHITIADLLGPKYIEHYW